MKLFSSRKKRGRHLNNGANNGTNESPELANSESASEKEIKTMSRKKKTLVILAIVFTALAALAASLYFVFFRVIKPIVETPPLARAEPKSTDYVPVDPRNPDRSGRTSTNPESDITGNLAVKYTFLLMALDDNNGNTDTIMAATFDATNHTLEVISIPRDTLANVSWSGVKKANSIYSNHRARNGWDDRKLAEAMDGVVESFADILGFMVDYWVLVDMRAFTTLIDAVDGIDYYIPVNMNYEDPYQDLYIHFSKGDYHLYGSDALKVMRFRSGYADADIGRIGTQQDFLMTAVQQILAKKNSLNIVELADIFIKYVKTDIKIDDIAWFGREFIQLDSDDIHFDILPGNYWDSVGGDSYVTIYVDQWLEMVNEKLNPFPGEITPDDVSILTRGPDGYLYVTDGNRLGSASWGSGRGTPYLGNSSISSPSPSSPGTNNPSTNNPSSYNPGSYNPGSGRNNQGTYTPAIDDDDNTPLETDDDQVNNPDESSGPDTGDGPLDGDGVDTDIDEQPPDDDEVPPNDDDEVPPDDDEVPPDEDEVPPDDDEVPPDDDEGNNEAPPEIEPPEDDENEQNDIYDDYVEPPTGPAYDPVLDELPSEESIYEN